MYNPGHFRNGDEDGIKAFIREHPFATLISFDGEEPCVSHIPLYLDGDERSLVGHVARGNAHWRLAGARSVAVFHGPHAYISAAWYQARDVVPTWNYVAVHARGNLSVLDPARTREVLELMIGRHEPDPDAFRESLGEAVRESLEAGIVGIKLTVEEWEGKWKLSQNKDAATRERLADRLDGTGGEAERRIARMMRDQA